MTPDYPTCSQCDQRAIARGYCKHHWAQWRKANPGPIPKRKGVREWVEDAIRSDTTQCIVVPGITTRPKYTDPDTKKTVRAARAVCEAVHGPPPTPKHQTAHAPGVCHNMLCINPAHLRWATREENQADTKIDGTDGPKGKFKLLPEEVIEIRERVADGESQASMARKFGLDTSTVHSIIHRRTWAYLP